MVARRRPSPAVGVLLLSALALPSCHRGGIGVGSAEGQDGGSRVDDCGAGSTVVVSGRVVIGGDACRGVISESTLSFLGSGLFGEVEAKVACGERFTVHLPAGKYNLYYRLRSDQFELRLNLPQRAEVGSVAVDLGDLVVPAHRVTGRLTVNGQAPGPLIGVASPCAEVGFNTPDHLNLALGDVDCRTAEFTAVVPDQTVELYYAGLEPALPAEVTGPVLPYGSRQIERAVRFDADASWAIDLRAVRVSGQIVPEPAMPGVVWPGCAHSATAGERIFPGALLWLETTPEASELLGLPVCDGKFDGYVWPETYRVSLSLPDAKGSYSDFLLQAQTDATSDVRDLRLPVQPVTWHGRLIAHGRPVDLPAGPLERLLVFTGGGGHPSWITVEGGDAASFTAVLPRAQFTVGGEEVVNGREDVLPPSLLTDESIDLTGAPPELDRELELDLYRTAGRATASGGVLAGCGPFHQLWLREDQPGKKFPRLSPLVFDCGPGGATFHGWARPGPYQAILFETMRGRTLSAGPVKVTGHRDDLVIDVPAAEWVRWRDERPPACAP